MQPNTTRPEFIMMVGLVGAGKTHWVMEHIKKTPEKNWVVVSSNDTLEKYARVCGISYNDAFKRFMDEAMLEMKRCLIQALQSGQNIIWDQTNTQVSARKRKLKDYANLLNAYRYHKRAVAINPCYEVLKQRALMGGRDVPEAVTVLMAETFSIPTVAEGFDEVEIITD